MTIFTFDDTVKLKPGTPRPGALASVVGISLERERNGDYLQRFPRGVIYTVEFEDGSDAEIPEDLLEAGKFPRDA